MKKDKNNPDRSGDPVGPVEELTAAMHATFWVTEEEELKHKVWAACREIERGVFSKAEILRMLAMSEDDFNKHKDTDPGSVPG